MSRLNLAINPKLRSNLERIAKIEGKSLTELINYRLEQSLTTEERLGEIPDWLIKHLQNNQDALNNPLPEPLKTIEEAIHNLEKTKQTLKYLYDQEVKMMM
jgi:hypothetical protein